MTELAATLGMLGIGMQMTMQIATPQAHLCFLSKCHGAFTNEADLTKQDLL